MTIATATLTGLRRSILLAPDDDDVRLVYADCAEEQGQGEYAEFIRVQIELAHLDAADCTCELDHTLQTRSDPQCPLNRVAALQRREQELLTPASRRDWSEPGLLAINVDHLAERYLYGRKKLPEYPCEFRRGFVEAIWCDSENFFEHTGLIFRHHPVQRVTLTDTPLPRRHEWLTFAPQIWPLLYSAVDSHRPTHWGDDPSEDDISAACVLFGRRDAGLEN